jgi:hypothetical protein
MMSDLFSNRLRSVYTQMARLLLQVAKHSFPRIGCISNAAMDELDDEWVIEHRPLSTNMNELVQVGGVVLSIYRGREKHLQEVRSICLLLQSCI